MSVFRDDFQQRSQGFERAYRATEDDSSLLSNCPFIGWTHYFPFEGFQFV